MLKHIWPPSALQWATFIVIVYFATVALAFHEIEPCNGVGGFLAALSCLEANEFGDLLAGLFAPLAFIGLGYAIYIQSQELAATREEMKLARDVSAENTGYIGTQTEIIKATEQRAELLRRDLHFERIIVSARSMFAEMFESDYMKINFFEEDGEYQTKLTAELPSNSFYHNEYFRFMAGALSVARQRWESYVEGATNAEPTVVLVRYEPLMGRLDEAIDLLPKTSIDNQTLYTEVDFVAIKRELHGLTLPRWGGLKSRRGD